MIRVLIFTNYSRWCQMDDGLQNRVSWDDCYPRKDGNAIAECVFQPGHPASLTVAKDCKREGVYLVSDFIQPFLFEQIKQQVGKEGKLYVLYHSLTHDHVVVSWFESLKDCVSRFGAHENPIPGKNYYYYDVFDCLTDKKDKKMDRVVDLLGLNEAERLRKEVNRFLIACVKPFNRGAKAACEDLCMHEDLKDMVLEFYNKQYPKRRKSGTEDAQFEDYTEGFAKIRDYLDEAVNKLVEESKKPLG